MSVTIDKTTSAKTGSPEADSARPRRSLGPMFEKYALVLALIAVVVVFSALRPETYPTANNLQNILGSQAVLLVLALGLIVPLTAGEFDLSAVSTMSLAAMTIAVLNVQHGWSLLPAIAVAVLACLVVGLINALLVVRLQIDSFIATLGSGTVVLGVVQWISDSTSVTGVDAALVDATIGTRIFGVSLQFYYALALVLIMAVVFQYTPIGRRLLFVGRGAQVARLSGLHVDRIRGGALVTSALVAALAGTVYAGMLGGADPSSGQSFMLPAFAAAFLGATAIVPGRFNAFGTLVAVYFLVAGVVGLQMLGVASFVQQLFYGGALVVAVALSGAVRRRTASRSTR
ncbi:MULTISPECIES: ABC transporter permease [unclassified Rhodococcus (in: high G+C Gram-positive bacteria)]|uniref:ABC transporter permease n=1 Tax=unclassified Rhodococcus (in: high G+C Gram-positive bacteria) TaxID=192944 RepID=UPI00233EC76B|nr:MULTISPECIES: ABC transporter permease [unclassified Rhodococcus (in: high G+C Gram-positive bacteria)]MDC3728521.1 ABC transporter permease [Rhodococcus sp. Rp3]WSE24179.1 ABC transporter permease [Rhodococcus sp. PD04]